MKILLLGDEDFNQKVLPLLSEAGFDVTSIKALGLDRKWYSDEEVLTTAIELDRVVLTHNKRHFIKLHNKVKLHPGIITCYQTADHVTLAKQVLELLERVDDFSNQLYRINRGS